LLRLLFPAADAAGANNCPAKKRTWELNNASDKY